MTYNAASRKDIRAKEKLDRVAEIERVNFLVSAMSLPSGRAWFYDRLEFCHLFNDPFTNDALAEAYRKGERNIGLKDFADILAHCPDHYITMMREANARSIAHDNLNSVDRSATELGGSSDPGRDTTEPDLDDPGVDDIYTGAR